MRLYPRRLVIVNQDLVVAWRSRRCSKGKAVHAWERYVLLIQRKPGALRSSAPFEDLPDLLI
jgi:hypothetical protein